MNRPHHEQTPLSTDDARKKISEIDKVAPESLGNHRALAIELGGVSSALSAIVEGDVFRASRVEDNVRHDVMIWPQSTFGDSGAQLRLRHFISAYDNSSTTVIVPTDPQLRQFIVEGFSGLPNFDGNPHPGDVCAMSKVVKGDSISTSRHQPFNIPLIESSSKAIGSVRGYLTALQGITKIVLPYLESNVDLDEDEGDN